MAAGRFRFRDISILKKMILTLLVTFLIPLVLAGVIMAFYLGVREAEYESRRDLAVLSSIGRELAATLASAEAIAGLVTTKGLLWSFAGKWESYHDYVSLVELCDDTIRDIPLIKSIVLYRDNRVVFERGPALDSDLPAYPEDLRQAILAGGGPCWTAPRRMNFFSAAEDPLMLPLYRALGGSGPGSPVLFTGVGANALAAHYRSYGKGSLFLLNEEGIALSAADAPGSRRAFPPGAGILRNYSAALRGTVVSSVPRTIALSCM